MRWEIQIVGNSKDLQILHEATRNEMLQILESTAGYILHSQCFNQLEMPGEVHALARKLITAISGASQIALSTDAVIKVGNITQVQDDGSKTVFLFPEPASLRLQVSVINFQVDHPDGTVTEYKAGDSILRWAEIAMRDEAVEKALRLRNLGDLDWVDLYRIYEVVEGDVGKKKLIESEWVKSGNELKRFERTANSVKAAGDSARHGADSNQPPKNPMTLAQGKGLVDTLLRFWIEDKPN